MRNKRLIIALTGAVVCGLIGVMLITRYLSSVQAYTKNLGNVVVAKQEIQLGEKITAEHWPLRQFQMALRLKERSGKWTSSSARVAITPIGVRKSSQI